MASKRSDDITSRFAAHLTRRHLIATSAAVGATLTVRPPVFAQPGATPQATPADDDFAGLVDIGGRSLYLECRGSGGPTVILESGAGNDGRVWDTVALEGATKVAVLPAVAGFTHVCAYDRPNTFLDPDHPSRSDPLAMPRTAAEIVADLHELLTAASVPGPYVMVGHSFGGLVTRLYASTYPADVVGLVLVDAVHDDWWETLDSALTPAQRDAAAAEPAEFPGLERIDTDASADQMREAAATSPLRPMPLVVLTHGRPWDWPPGFPVDAIEAIWRPLQDDLIALVPDARLVVAEQSRHHIQIDEPNLVIEAIRQVVDAVRDPETWSSSTAIGDDQSAIDAGGFRS